jgi:hypothetical protein
MVFRQAWAALVLAAAPAVASAQCVIDQDQPSATVYMAAFSQTSLAQSFQTTQSGICGAGIFLQPNIGLNDLVTIQLWNNLPNAGGVMLAQASAQGFQGTWVDVFWTSVSITPNTTYYLVFEGNTTLGIAGDVADPYPFGQVYANFGYGSFPSFDYTFRTYSSPICPQPAAFCTAGTTTHGCVPAIGASGTPAVGSTSGFVVNVSGVEGQKSGIVFYGINNTGFTPTPWALGSSSFLCVKAPTQRMTTQSSGGTINACDGALSIDWLAWVTANPGSLGLPLAAGQTYFGQAWFRDPPAPKTTNLSNGLRWTICP